MKKGFTLLELIVVIIIIGILATLGFTQYTMVIEKGRSAEARAVLSTVRTAAAAYLLENGTYPASISNLAVSAPTSCTSTNYFYYSFQQSGCECGGAYEAVAWRCTAGGKTPNASAACVLPLCIDSGRFVQSQCGSWVICY